MLGAHAQLTQFQAASLLVEQTQYHPLAVPGRQGRNPHINCPANQSQTDTAVLRQAFFGDIQLGHDLDPRDDHWRQRARRLQYLTQHTVDPQANRQAVFKGFDMNIGRIFLDRLGQQRVDQTNDRRLILGLQQVFRLGQRLRDREQVSIITQPLDKLHGVIGRAFVAITQARSKAVIVQHHRQQRVPQTATQLQQALRVAVGAHEDFHLAVVTQAAGQYPDPPGKAVTGVGRRAGRRHLGEDVRLAHDQSPLAAGGALMLAGGVPCMAFSNGGGSVSR